MIKEEKKYLMIHADDAGLSWSQNKATQLGMVNGSISSTSLMVPCPWFYEMANFCLQNPDIDYGIHLTLTGEWKTYPFKPCSDPKKIPSLVNKSGYFHPNKKNVKELAKADEVYFELKNQIKTAISLGLKPSHLDSHSYTLGMRQDLIDVYQQLGSDFKLPILLSRTLVSYTGQDASAFKIPDNQCFESIHMVSMNEFENGGLASYYDKVIDNLPDGISILLIHPALASDEMNQITIDHPNFGAKWRTADSDYFLSASCKEKLEKRNIELINWKSPVIRKNF